MQPLMMVFLGWVLAPALSRRRSKLLTLLVLSILSLGTYLLEVVQLFAEFFGEPWVGSTLVGAVFGARLREVRSVRMVPARFLVLTALLLVGIAWISSPWTQDEILFPGIDLPMDLDALLSLSISLRIALLLLIFSVLCSMMRILRVLPEGFSNQGASESTIFVSLPLLVAALGEVGIQLSYEYASHGDLAMWWRFVGPAVSSVAIVGFSLVALAWLLSGINGSVK